MYHSLFGLNPDAVFCFDLDWRVVSANASLERLSGYTSDEMLGVPFSSIIVEHDRERARRYFQRAVAGHAQSFEFTGIGRDGREFYVAASYFPVIENGVVIGVYGTAKDISAQREAERALRESEERYRLLADNVHDMISLHDLDGRFLYASPAAQRLLGFHPVELIGKSVFDIAHPDDIPALRSAHETVLTRTGKNALTFRARRSDGTEGWFETSARMTEIGDDGTPPRIVGVTRDVSERRNLEQQLGQIQKLDAVGRLAGGLAHDFNNLLTIVLARAERLLEQFEDNDPRQREIEEIRMAARRSAALIAQLLAVGRREMGTPRTVDINGQILAFLPILQRLASARNELATDFDPDAGAIHVDPTQLEQILLNLVVNARDALEEKPGSITITTRNVRVGGPSLTPQPVVTPGEYVLLSVHDTGIGMDAQTREHIFEPFFTTKSEGAGTGLGLATVYAIVQGAGGDITCESVPGVGTTFRVYFPRIASPHAADAEDLTGTETILLVEDEPDLRTVTRIVLETRGYRVIEVESADVALELAQDWEQPPELLLSDVIMPGLKGPELAQRLRALYPEMRVLYISGYSDVALKRLGVREDGALFVQKPFSPDDLARMVRRALKPVG